MEKDENPEQLFAMGYAGTKCLTNICKTMLSWIYSIRTGGNGKESGRPHFMSTLETIFKILRYVLDKMVDELSCRVTSNV